MSKFAGTTHIGVCIDRSGSMQGLEADTIGGFNAWLKETRAAEEAGDVRLTLQLFDNEHLWPYEDAPLETVRKLNGKTYVPRGSTALRDAIGLTIGKLERVVERGDRALVVIITDGAENASLEISAEQLKVMIAKAEKRKNWSFTYLGANQDAWQVSRDLGFRVASAISTDHSGVGTRSAYSSLAGQTVNVASSANAAAAPLRQSDYDAEVAKEQKKQAAGK